MITKEKDRLSTDLTSDLYLDLLLEVDEASNDPLQEKLDLDLQAKPTRTKTFNTFTQSTHRPIHLFSDKTLKDAHKVIRQAGIIDINGSWHTHDHKIKLRHLYFLSDF